MNELTIIIPLQFFVIRLIFRMSFFDRMVELCVLLDPAYDRVLGHVDTIQEGVSYLRHKTRVGRSKVVSDAVATACGEKSLLERFEPVINEVL